MKREILHEKVTVYRQPDSGNFEAGRKRYAGNGTLPPARDEQFSFLQVASNGGIDASLMARMRELERENARLKKMYADAQLHAEVVQEALAKKW